MSTHLCDMSDVERLSRLVPPTGPVELVLDTDTYNELDDQFALVWALLRPDRLRLCAVHAAPFHNSRSSGPADGMHRSHEEILRVFDRLAIDPGGRVFKGSTAYLSDAGQPHSSPAAADLVERAMARPADGAPLYVAAIGCATNVASALLIEPAIARRIVVVWLGGQPTCWHTAYEFNLKQDLHATRVLLDSGVPLVRIPCRYVAEQLRTSRAEMESYVRGRGMVGDYLYETYTQQVPNHPGCTKVVWDLAVIAWLLDPTWVSTVIAHSPIVTDMMGWHLDSRRHLIREAIHLDREAIYRDLFSCLDRHAAESSRRRGSHLVS